MNPDILVTGFEPFGGDALNASRDIAQALDGASVAGRPVHGVVLPVRFDQAPQALAQALARWRPSVVLCLGLAASRSGVSIERVALNLIDARIADNAGRQPIDAPVLAGATPAYFSSLPVKAMARALRVAGIAAEVSTSAGTFVCNQVFYALMHQLCACPGARGGFAHLPPMPQQVPGPEGGTAMAGAMQRRAVELMLTVAVERTVDDADSAGRVD